MNQVLADVDDCAPRGWIVFRGWLADTLDANWAGSDIVVEDEGSADDAEGPGHEISRTAVAL